MAIFNSYVKLPEGIPQSLNPQRFSPPALAAGCWCGISVRHHSAKRLTRHSVAHCATGLAAVPGAVELWRFHGDFMGISGRFNGDLMGISW